jgi:hypothetical protein
MRISSGTASQISWTKFMASTIRPMAMPSGMTRTDLRRVMNLAAATTAPIATPTATTPWSIEDFERSRPERDFGPLDDDELQRRAGTPEQRGDGQRDLAQAVAPEQG